MLKIGDRGVVSQRNLAIFRVSCQRLLTFLFAEKNKIVFIVFLSRGDQVIS